MKKLALVGGSSAGIGKAVAQGLLKEGFNVILTARGAERLEAAETALKKNYPDRKVYAFASDYASSKSVEGLISAINKGPGAPDVLVLNTGGPKAGTFDDIALEDWENAFQQQFKSSLMLLKAFLPAMRKKKWGRIINISSTIALEPTIGMILSAGYRAMLINALKCTAHLVGKDSITVNTVCPGAVLTDRLLSLFKDQAKNSGKTEKEVLEGAAKMIPLQRIASPEEFANLAVFLASDDASFISGTVIPVDGGMTRKSS